MAITAPARQTEHPITVDEFAALDGETAVNTVLSMDRFDLETLLLALRRVYQRANR